MALNNDADQTPAAWYAVQLKPGGFDAARRNLDRQGFSVFMPHQLTPARGRGKPRAAKPTPLFPGYLFVHVPRDRQDWRVINNTLGVSRLLMARADRPAELPSGFIAALRARCDEDGLFRATENYQPGDSVALISGPFAGLIAKVEALPRQGRVSVLLELLGRSVRSEVPPEHLDVIPLRSSKAG